MAEERSSVSPAQLVRPAEAVAKASAKASLPSRKAKGKASFSGVDAGGAASRDAAAVLSSTDPAATVPGVAAKTSAIGTLAITVPVQVNSLVPPPDGGRAGSECPSFSQLLAGAMASPAGSSRASPILTVPVDGTRLPVVAVPCIIAPAALLDSPGFTGQFAMTHQAVLATVTAQAQMQLQSGYTQPAILSSHVPIQQRPLLTSSDNTSSSAAEQPPSLGQKHQIDQVVPKTNSTDGYNWRKYGQKQVKSGDNFRSYYKCTQANCFAKKKVERSQVGHVVEVIYRGEHNHDPPQRTKCSKERGPQPNIPFGDNETSTIASGYVAGGFGLSPAKISNGFEHNKYAPKAAGSPMERRPPSSSPSRDKEMSPPASIDENGAEVSPKMDQKPVSDVPGCQLQNLNDCKSAIDNKCDDHHVSRPDPKRRQIESSLPSPSSVKTVKETKVVVQMASEMGLVSDGYRWRKYGQKIVKGNPNPRSYYRCTQIGCLVRKHVERDSTDARALIMTYEGKHNHELPTPKNEGDIPPLLYPAAADREAKAANSSADQHSKDEPSKAPDEKTAEFVGDKTLESAETLLSMSAAKEGDGDRKNSDAIQRPQNCAAVPV